ncbi:MAG: hypothetical protein U0353_20305 [Sandaracinus sp.]
MRHTFGVGMTGIGAASLALAACGARPPTVNVAPQAPGSAVFFVQPPVIDGSRTACLAPPYAPDAGATDLDGALVTHAEGTRVWELKLPGTRDASAEESQALLTRIRALGGEHEYLSYGVYCGGGAHLCFAWEGNLCETRIEERLAWFRALVQRDGALADARLELAVTLVGHEGPRCAPSDPRCQPLAYEGGDYDPARARHAGPLATHSAGACDHDGDCMVMGCGNHCLSWQYGGAHEGATCEGYVFGEPVFCGCVEGACAWFTQ